jgi:hypothetical protein
MYHNLNDNFSQYAIIHFIVFLNPCTDYGPSSVKMTTA